MNQDLLCIETDCEMENVNLIDLSGRVVRSASATGNKAEIRIGDLPSGLYMIQAGTAQGVRYCKWMKK